MADKKKDKGRRNLGTGITQRADGRYCYRKTKKGEKPICVYANSYEEIVAIKKRIERDLDNGVKFGAGDVTLNEWIYEFLDGKENLRDTTKESYRFNYDKYIGGKLGHKKLSALTREDFLSLYKGLLKEKINMNTLKYIQSLPLQALERARVRGKISKNPHEGVITELIEDLGEGEAKEVISLTRDEQNAFMNYAKSHSEYWRYVPLFTVLLGTGMRIGEALGLTWDDVNFEDNEIYIDKTLLYAPVDGGKAGFHMHKAKTKSGKRSIPMLAEVKEAFMLLKTSDVFLPSKSVIDGYSDFVFTSSVGTAYISKNLNRIIKKITDAFNREEAEKANAENKKPFQIRPFTLHSFRHTFATNYCQHETNLKTIQEIMGHANFSLTMDVYARAQREKKQESFKALEGKMFF